MEEILLQPSLVEENSQFSDTLGWTTWQEADGRSLKFVYLFCGPRRKSDVRECLTAVAKQRNFKLEGVELDLLRGPQQDLLSEALWRKVRVFLQEADFVLVAPPCNTFSRARCQWRTRPGPRPIRDINHVYGFPWASEGNRKSLEQANQLVWKSFEACEIVSQHGGHFGVEHPEQLGRTGGMTPASIWDWKECRDLLLTTQGCSFAFFQCQFAAATSKPTRMVASDSWEGAVVFAGLPQLDWNGAYKGPLPHGCPHGKHEAALVGKTEQDIWRTSAAAAYPPAMCDWIATNIVRTWLARCSGGGLSEQAGRKKEEDKVEEASFYSAPTFSAMVEAKQVLDRAASQTDGQDEEVDSFHGFMMMAKLHNYGQPLTVRWRGKKAASFVDGCGLNSPGRWRPKQRGLGISGEVADFIERLREVVQRWTRKHVGDLKKQFFRLALGKMEETPFQEAELNGLRAEWFSLLEDPVLAREQVANQPFFLQAIAQTARRMEDEDWKVLVEGEDNYTQGRRVGFKSAFPRVPLVFRPKLKYRQYDDTELREDNVNYTSAQAHEDTLEKQFQEEEAMGFMYPLSEAEARRRFGERLRIASLGAICKEDGTVRALHDATHFVKVNSEIVIQDRLEFPGPANSCRLMEASQEDGHRFMLAVAADIAKAHRRFLHHPDDHGLLACRAKPGGAVWVNRVGTFGVAPAAYHFGRLAAILGRLVLRLAMQDHLYQLLFADDLKLVAAGEHKYLVIWSAVVAWLMMGTPFKWCKFRGGLELDYVGFYFDYTRFEAGLSEKRTTWLVQWIEGLERDKGMVLHRRFVEFLGRLVYASQLLYWAKPFLAPLHAWKSAVGGGAVLQVPKMVLLVLRYLNNLLRSGNRMVSSKAAPEAGAEVFRTDAKCGEDFVVLGGWQILEEGEPGLWFSLRISKDELPHFFGESGHASRLSTAAELLATLAALHAFKLVEARGPQCVSIAAGTDNLATDFVVKGNSTNKFPLAWVHMQLAFLLFQVDAALDLRWRPREENVLADQLTNEIFTGVRPDKRVELKLEHMDLRLFHELAEYHDEVMEWKGQRQAKKCVREPGMSKKRKMETRTEWG